MLICPWLAAFPPAFPERLLEWVRTKRELGKSKRRQTDHREHSSGTTFLDQGWVKKKELSDKPHKFLPQESNNSKTRPPPPHTSGQRMLKIIDQYSTFSTSPIQAPSRAIASLSPVLLQYLCLFPKYSSTYSSTLSLVIPRHVWSSIFLGSGWENPPLWFVRSLTLVRAHGIAFGMKKVPQWRLHYFHVTGRVPAGRTTRTCRPEGFPQKPTKEEQNTPRTPLRLRGSTKTNLLMISIILSSELDTFILQA